MRLLNFRSIVFAVFISAGLTGCWSPSEIKTSSEKTDSKTQSATPTKSAEESKSEKEMNNSTTSEIEKTGFSGNLPSGFSMPSDAVGQKMLKEYGAMFVAKNGAVPPSKVVFNNEADVSAWQSGIAKSSETIGGAAIELQTAAMSALKKAIEEAKQKNLSITPRGGSDAARRDYGGTVTNWKSRVEPGLKHWVEKGKIKQADADRIRSLSIPQQITEIFKLEEQGIYFAKDLSKSIIYSVAPPGTSQHISMLALDVTEHEDPRVRAILAENGWHQTVVSDLPHFTFLGVNENELPKLGLKKVPDAGRTYWIPNL